MKGFIIPFAAAFLLTCDANLVNAQGFSSAEIDRGLQYRNTTPWDGKPFTQRYNDSYSPNFYFNSRSPQTYYLDYLDRLDRARKFGYPIPADPFFPEMNEPEASAEPQPVVAQPTPRRILFRRFR